MGRLDSVDAMRGATIAGMIVVNNPGTWSAVYPPLRHAEWHGWTYTDTIFPFFLFLVGVSMALSFGGRRETGATRSALIRKTAVRAAILVAIGLLLNLVGFLALHRDHFRIPGVLQRIGLCVLVGGLVYLAAGARGAAWTAAGLLLLYGALLAAGPLDPEGSLPSRLDRAIFGTHTWSTAFDPEGLLSTLGAIATTFFGTLAGERLRGPIPVPMSRRLAELLAAGGAAALLGLALGRVLPISKNLWSPSYALLMAGLAAVALAVCVALIDGSAGSGARRVAAPFVWLGRNAIAAFTLSSLTSIALIAIRVTGPDGKPRSLWTTIYRGAFDRFADPRLGSLLFAAAYLAIWVAIFGLLYRKRIFVKI
jgi:predicted acyltransferase